MQANTGSGLVGDAAAPYYTGEPGDVIAMGNDHFRHIVMISEVLTDESGNTVDYLICSNTGDLCDFPAGAYFYTYQAAYQNLRLELNIARASVLPNGSLLRAGRFFTFRAVNAIIIF